MSDTSSIQAIRSAVTAKVRALLARHGTPDHRQQIPVLMAILQASYSQVYRKVSGRSAWLEEDLYLIAAHFQETLGGLFRDDACDAPVGISKVASAPSDWRAATVAIGGIALNCHVLTGNKADTTGALALVDTAQGPQVLPANNTGTALFISAIQIDLSASKEGGFAVFDDDPDVADAISDALLARGLEAQAFYTTQELSAATRRFDTYILDWFSSDSHTTADLIAHLRTAHAPKATIVVLTGQIQRERVESDLAQLIRVHDVLVELKPMRVDLLLAKIAHTRQA